MKLPKPFAAMSSPSGKATKSTPPVLSNRCERCMPSADERLPFGLRSLRMEERLRFTGENPPLSLWARFPNWQNAIEEETFPGQDETTLRPADNQQTIDDEV